MVLTRAPLRISLFGGGTDYPEWISREGGGGGQVLSGTIDKYCWITARILPPFFYNHKHRIVWSQIEEVMAMQEIQHPAARAVMDFLHWSDGVGVEIHHQGDLPARSGMGSSSAFTVALLHALITLKGEAYATSSSLADDAMVVEQNKLKEHVGAQDQCAAAYGGFNRYTFTSNTNVHVHRAVVPWETLKAFKSRLSLWYLGPRAPGVTASDIAAKYEPKPHHLRVMSSMVEEALSLFGAGNLDAVGRLLHEGWLLKREMGGGDPRADGAYSCALEAGAVGGKLLGAGGGGFLLLYGFNHEKLGDALQVPFKFTDEGSRVVYCGETL